MPESPTDVRAFLVAQLRWERYRTSRLALVHVLAFSAVCVWLPIPAWLHALLAAACAVCFVATLFAGTMEWRWARERDRRAGAFSVRNGRG